MNGGIFLDASSISTIKAALADWKKVIKVFALPWFQKMLGVAMMVVFAVEVALAAAAAVAGFVSYIFNMKAKNAKCGCGSGGNGSGSGSVSGSGGSGGNIGSSYGVGRDCGQKRLKTYFNFFPINNQCRVKTQFWPFPHHLM